MKKIQITPNKLDALIKDYLSGKSVSSLAKENNISRTATQRILIENNIKLRTLQEQKKIQPPYNKNKKMPKEFPWLNNCTITGVNFGGAGDEYYANLGTMSWGKIKECIDGMQLPDDEELIGQLTTRRLKMQPTGKNILESKDDMKRRKISSPDRADALALSFSESKPELHVF